MAFDAIAFVQDLLQRGRLKPHRKPEYSKLINFYLDYKSGHGSFLEPFFEKITEEIEQQENRNRRAEDVRQRFAYCVRALILNAMDVATSINDNLFLSISLNRNNYGLNKRYAPKAVAFRPFEQAFYGLVSAGYLKIHRKGYYDPEGFNDTSQTQICATEKLIGAFQDFVSGREFSVIRRPAIGDDLDETIILRGTDRRKQEYDDDVFTNRARNNLNRINAVLSAHEYRLDLPEGMKVQLHKDLISNHILDNEAQPFIDFSSVRLYRIFSDGSFDKGGRFYRGWWINVPKKYRPYITIDGQKTTEFDYSAFHPSILYAEQGLALDFDAYKIHPNVKRDIGKAAFNALLNAEGRPKKPAEFDEDETGISWTDFLNLMMEKHKVLTDAGYFLKRYGLHVQFLDAELAEKILLHFAERDIPCLCIHDSFIISQDKAEELKTIMEEVYRDKFNQSINIKCVY